jgi:hypothetical protein
VVDDVPGGEEELFRLPEVAGGAARIALIGVDQSLQLERDRLCGRMEKHRMSQPGIVVRSLRIAPEMLLGMAEQQMDQAIAHETPPGALDFLELPVQGKSKQVPAVALRQAIQPAHVRQRVRGSGRAFGFLGKFPSHELELVAAVGAQLGKVFEAQPGDELERQLAVAEGKKKLPVKMRRFRHEA